MREACKSRAGTVSTASDLAHLHTAGAQVGSYIDEVITYNNGEVKQT